MNTKKMLIYVLSGLLLTGGCTDGFDEMNIDPNNPTPETVDPNYILSTALLCGTLNIDTHQRIHSLTVDIFAQYISNEDFTTNLCVPVEGWTNDFWTKHYTYIDMVNDIIINQKDNAMKVNTVQIARIWRVWLYSRATDLFGDIPYFDAANGTGELPRYDKQQEIYYDMCRELKEAAQALDSLKANPGTNDFIFSGKIEQWRKFANALRLRLAMRMSEADPAKAKAEAEDAVVGNILPSSNSETVKINRTTSYLWWGYYYCYPTYFSWGELAMSKSMEKLLTGLGGLDFPAPAAFEIHKSVPAKVDPRGPVYFNVTTAKAGADADHIGLWRGIPAGLGVEEGKSVENIRTNNSRLGYRYVGSVANDGSITLKDTREMILMPYSEVCFLRAEGAARGWNMGGQAKDFYEAGIRASMTETGIADDVTEKYLVSENPNSYGTSVAFNHTTGSHNTPLDKIITQKYIANFPDNGWEAFNDYRRLWMPSLDPFVSPDPTAVVEPGSTTWKGSIRRLTYPATEPIVNKAYYEEAAARMGGDKTTSRVWWDAKQ